MNDAEILKAIRNEANAALRIHKSMEVHLPTVNETAHKNGKRWQQSECFEQTKKNIIQLSKLLS